jgi:hypothetical protein
MIQVLWLGHPQHRATWEPEASLTKKLVEDFENGVAKETVTDTESLYGHVCNILTSSEKTSVSEPKSKKARLSHDLDRG